MRYFIDTEFHEEPGTLELISIGIVSENSRTLYRVASDGWHPDRCNDWVREHVLPNLGGPAASRGEIKDLVLQFIGTDKPEFWGYYADYDWVAFCWLFGRMVDLPKGWPMFCRDLKQMACDLGNPTLPHRNDTHNALADALDVKRNYEFLSVRYRR